MQKFRGVRLSTLQSYRAEIEANVCLTVSIVTNIVSQFLSPRGLAWGGEPPVFEDGRDHAGVNGSGIDALPVWLVDSRFSEEDLSQLREIKRLRKTAKPDRKWPLEQLGAARLQCSFTESIG